MTNAEFSTNGNGQTNIKELGHTKYKYMHVLSSA